MDNNYNRLNDVHLKDWTRPRPGRQFADRVKWVGIAIMVMIVIAAFWR